jgi:lipopolysaccharide export LptBFGC system permease protein LptF
VAGFLAYPSAAWHDALLALGRLADPLLLLALALSAGCFGLLVLRRRRA